MRLIATDLSVRYGARAAVRDVALTAEPGEVLAILGANGSGKTSLLRALAGVQKHTGSLRWQATARRPSPGGGLGYMPQDNAVRAGLTAFEVVLLGRLRSLSFRVEEADLEAARGALAELDILALARQPIGELSGGQRQLVFLAQVLAADPAALLLDEPTSALDIAHQLRVLRLLRAATHRRGLTTLAVLHDLNAAARFADRIALMQAGRLVAIGPPRAVLTAASLRACYGVEVGVLEGPDGAPVVLPLHPVEPGQTDG